MTDTRKVTAETSERVMRVTTAEGQPLAYQDMGGLVRCRDCKHYTPDDEFFVDIGIGMPLPAATCDTCDLWANTKTKTAPDGYCFMGERRDDD